jgi:hypothetical protein
MPANLTPDYLAAEREYKSAQTNAEKIAALERMMATLPKHKGTEKLQADLRRRLSQARKESQKKSPAHAAPFYAVEKEGAGQVVLIGPPNSGKSQLVATLTNAEPEIADYPFTTRFPTPGMMPYEDVQIQLVDLPPISAEFMEPWTPQVIRNAGLGVLLMDVNDSAILDEIEFIEQMIERHRLARPPLLAGNKLDLPGAEANLAALSDLYGARYRTIGISAATGRNGPQPRRIRPRRFRCPQTRARLHEGPRQEGSPHRALRPAPRPNRAGRRPPGSQGFRRAPEIRPPVPNQRQPRRPDGRAHTPDRGPRHSRISHLKQHGFHRSDVHQPVAAVKRRQQPARRIAPPPLRNALRPGPVGGKVHPPQQRMAAPRP